MQNYQYNININQFAIIENNWDIDIQDACILSYIINYSTSQSIKKKIDNGILYFYISSKNIIDNLPILKITTKRGIDKRIDNLISCELLVRHDQNSKSRMAYYALTEKVQKYLFCENKRSTIQEQTFVDTKNKCSTKHYTIKHNTNKHIIIPSDEESLVKECHKQFIDFWCKEHKPYYVFSRKDAKAINDIVKKVIELQKGNDNITAEQSLNSFKYICKFLDTQNDFFKTADLSVINSKFNVIIENIKIHSSKQSQKSNLQELKNKRLF